MSGRNVAGGGTFGVFLNEGWKGWVYISFFVSIRTSAGLVQNAILDLDHQTNDKSIKILYLYKNSAFKTSEEEI